MKALPGLLALVFVMVTAALFLTGRAENSGWGVSPGGLPINNSAPASGSNRRDYPPRSNQIARAPAQSISGVTSTPTFA
jgi:hypothetical protein